MYKILETLDYIHENGVMHRDIKPQNILFDPSNKVLKIIDWGSAEVYSPAESYFKYVTTRAYKAPELIIDNN